MRRYFVETILKSLVGATFIFFFEGVVANVNAKTIEVHREIPVVGFHNFKEAPKRDTQTGILQPDSPMPLANDTEQARLICESLENAKGATLLNFVLGNDKMVVADLVLFTTTDGSSFSDGNPRNIWMGTVRQTETETEGQKKVLPRTISMTWTDGCAVETFFVQMTSPAESDGGVDTVRSLPIDEEGEFLIVKAHKPPIDELGIRVAATDVIVPGGRRLEPSASAGEHTFLREGSPRSTANDGAKILRKRRILAEEVERGVKSAKLASPDIDAKDGDIRLLQEYLSASPQGKGAFYETGLRRLSEDSIVMPSGRVLATKPEIDVLILYTSNALKDSASGSSRSRSQMESDIATAYQGANVALLNSGVDATIRIVKMELTSIMESGDMFQDVQYLQRNEDVKKLRNEYGADLVQLITNYASDPCGVGFTMTTPSSGFSEHGFSVVHSDCLSNLSHIHELGHNMGANHDKENSLSTHPYAFAYRKCTGIPAFRTIMAYSTGCTAPRVNVFSNPDLTYADHVQGSDTANNARALNEAVSTIVNFRSSIVARSVVAVTPTSKPAPVPAPAPAPQPTPLKSIYPAKLSNKRMKRMGCFRDDVTDRVMVAGSSMPAISGKTIGMTLDNCLAYCWNHDNNYKFFGAQYAHECFCRNSTKYKRLGELPASACSMLCAGDPTETCGGGKALEVFKILDITIADNALYGPVYQGCYRDKLHDLRMANEEMLNFQNSSPEVCNAHCSKAGYLFFALEFGFMCSCGNSLPDENRWEHDDSKCSTPCTGPSTDSTCGGRWYQAIFSVYHGGGV